MIYNLSFLLWTDFDQIWISSQRWITQGKLCRYCGTEKVRPGVQWLCGPGPGPGPVLCNITTWTQQNRWQLAPTAQGVPAITARNPELHLLIWRKCLITPALNQLKPQLRCGEARVARKTASNPVASRHFLTRPSFLHFLTRSKVLHFLTRPSSGKIIALIDSCHATTIDCLHLCRTFPTPSSRASLFEVQKRKRTGSSLTPSIFFS